MPSDHQPQELVIFKCALVFTEGNPRRPRMLILDAPSVEGVDLVKLAEQWLTAARVPNAFPAIHDLHSNTGLDLNIGGLSAPARPFPTPTVRVHEDHPAFATTPPEEGTFEQVPESSDNGRRFPMPKR